MRTQFPMSSSAIRRVKAYESVDRIIQMNTLYIIPRPTNYQPRVPSRLPPTQDPPAFPESPSAQQMVRLHDDDRLHSDERHRASDDSSLPLLFSSQASPPSHLYTSAAHLERELREGGRFRSGFLVGMERGRWMGPWAGGGRDVAETGRCGLRRTWGGRGRVETWSGWGSWFLLGFGGDVWS